jgi:hypothetical protein
MSKIFLLSLGRTGTTSSHLFFQKLGYSSIHLLKLEVDFKKIEGFSTDEIIKYAEHVENKYDAFTGYPYNVSYEYFDKKYPDAKFILITRPVSEWVPSIKRHSKGMPFTPPRLAAWSDYISKDAKRIEDVTDLELQKLYNDHNKKVLEYFKDSNRFLHLDLYDQEKNIKICKFLGKANVELEFEHTSKVR